MSRKGIVVLSFWAGFIALIAIWAVILLNAAVTVDGLPFLAVPIVVGVIYLMRRLKGPKAR